MRKLLLVVLASISTIAGLQAQNTKMVKFKAGVAEPVGRFGAIADDNKSGYAQTGWNVGIEGAYYLNDWFGLGGNVTYSYHNFDNQALSRIMTAESDYELVSGSADYYDNLTYSIGPYFKYDFTERFSVQAKTHVGILTVFRPELFVITDFVSSYSFDLMFLDNQYWDNSTALNLGLGLQYLVSDNVAINLDSEFTTGSPNFAYYSPRRPSIVIRDERSVSFVNMNLGVSYHFW